MNEVRPRRLQRRRQLLRERLGRVGAGGGHAHSGRQRDPVQGRAREVRQRARRRALAGQPLLGALHLEQRAPAGRSVTVLVVQMALTVAYVCM